MRALLFAVLLASLPSITVADVQKVEAKQAPKATVASVTARRDKLLTVRDKLRELVAQPVPEKLSADHKKAYDKFIGAAKQTATDADALAAKLTAGLKEKTPKLDSLSELGEMESIKLQKYMDGEAQTMSKVSNVLKKISDTAGTITQNFK